MLARTKALEKSQIDHMFSGVTRDNLHRETDPGVAIGNEIW